MTEFGHIGVKFGGFCLDAWGAGPFVITVDGKEWSFEDSDRFGPLTLDRRGSPHERQPGERNPFWRAHTCWRWQGRRLEQDGKTCIWDEPRPTKVKKIRKLAIVVEHGDEYWPITEVVGKITAEDLSSMKARLTPTERR